MSRMAIEDVEWPPDWEDSTTQHNARVPHMAVEQQPLPRVAQCASSHQPVLCESVGSLHVTHSYAPPAWRVHSGPAELWLMRCARCCRVFEREGVRVVCDDLSLEFLRGATVDYESDLMKSAFVVSAAKQRVLLSMCVCLHCTRQPLEKAGCRFGWL